jgi:hypothetical protein
LYLSLRLKEKAFIRLEPYITQILNKDYAKSENEVRRIFNNTEYYFNLLRQSFGDLDKVRIVELQLLNLKQKGLVPEYLTRFT